MSLKAWLIALALCLGGLLFFLWGIREPTGPYYDEQMYVSAANALLSDSPVNPSPEGPPMGKVLMALGVWLLGDNPLGWRVPSALFGSLALAATFLWAYLLLENYALALSAAALTLFNNFLFVFSRTAMMDIFLVCFLLWALLSFSAAIKVEEISPVRRRALLVFSGMMFGFACASKWNAIDTLGIVIALSAGSLIFFSRASNGELARAGRLLGAAGLPWVSFALLLVPLLTYVLTFWPLCRSLQRPFSLREVVAMNDFIWRFHLGVVGNATIISPWYTWPFQVSPHRAFSYLVGNWYVMWAGLAALLFCARCFLRNLPETLVILLYLANLLQWAVTPQRCLYYYYYFPAATFLGLAIPVMLHRLPARMFGLRLSILCVLPAMGIFAFCYPRMAHLAPPFDCALGCWP